MCNHTHPQTPAPSFTVPRPKHLALEALLSVELPPHSKSINSFRALLYCVVSQPPSTY